MADELIISMYTMCLVQDGNKVLLLNRPEKLGFPGYLAPGGKVDFPESLTEAAIREVWEETGLRVKNLVYKGLDEYVNRNRNTRGMVFNYITSTFEGELLDNPPEGELAWVRIDDALNLPCNPGLKHVFPSSLQKGHLRFTSCGMMKPW